MQSMARCREDVLKDLVKGVTHGSRATSQTKATHGHSQLHTPGTNRGLWRSAGTWHFLSQVEERSRPVGIYVYAS